MFVGQHEHSLDPKGRVVLPASFRSAVVDRGYVTNLGSCIGLWDEEGFQAITEELKKLLAERTLSQDDFRKMMRETRQVKLDSAGRITVPRELLDELGFDREVVITGRWDRVEIWPAAVFAEKNAATDSNAKLADTIDALGL
ncbi:MAG: hypothetical protein R2733_21100 [Acidimicrobiales bacterium]